MSLCPTRGRTQAIDNVSSVFRKMFTVGRCPANVSITIMTAGNLGTTQAVVSLLEERAKPADERGDSSVLEAPSMFQIARLVGQTLREVIAEQTGAGGYSADAFSATLILGGQVRGGEPRLFLIYPEGNFVEVSEDTPFVQIGETKYGKPILVRAYDPEMSFEEAVKLLMLSFDSTIKANLSVGLPLDLHLYEADSLRHGRQLRIEREDPFYNMLSEGWGDALRQAFDALPSYTFD